MKNDKRVGKERVKFCLKIQLLFYSTANIILLQLKKDNNLACITNIH